MTQVTFHLVDAATGRFLRVRGSDQSSRYYLTLEDGAPAYSTADIADIHRIMREAVDPSPRGRYPYGIPKLDEIDDAFYPVTAVKRYGAIVPGGDPVLLSTDLMRVELSEVHSPKSVPSRDFSKTPRLILKNYLPPEVIGRLDQMTPEFLVLRGSAALAPGEFVMTDDWKGPKIGEVVHAAPLPDGWPLSLETDPEDLQLVFVDYSSVTPSYTLTEIEPVLMATPSRAPTF